jgi:hypothetical protein
MTTSDKLMAEQDTGATETTAGEVPLRRTTSTR